MPTQATIIQKGAELSGAFSAALDGAEADALYAVELRKLTPEEADTFLAVRAEVQEGLADIEAGRVHSMEEARKMLGLTV